MAVAHPALAFDWLGASRRAARAAQGVMREHPTTRERVRETGDRGEGGDQTLVIDAAAEDAVFAELATLHDAGARFTAISEERGTVDFGDPDVLVVVDPLDGSVNAKREHGRHAVSIAVADGPTVADVAFAFVFDHATGEEWRAVRGEGAWLDDRALAGGPPERRKDDGRLELVAVEQADPHNLARASDGLIAHVGRIRVLGAMAISLCEVAAARVDGMVSLWRTRSVDVAAAQLVVRESGGCVCFVGCDEPLGAPLTLEPHSPMVAARTQAGVDQLAEIVR